MNRKWSIGFLLIFFASVVWAAVDPTGSTTPTSNTTGGFFTIPAKDVSQYLLGFVFDQVGTVLTTFSGESTIFKNVLIDFNNAIVVLGAIVIVYALFVSILNTAHEGQMLGEKWNSVWIPLRAAGGFSLILPITAKGYSVIQVFVMWVILQGVGAADTIWIHTLKAIATGESTIPSSKVNNYELAGEIFISQSCTFYLSNEITNNPQWTVSLDFAKHSFKPQVIIHDAKKSDSQWWFGTTTPGSYNSHDKQQFNQACGILFRDNVQNASQLRMNLADVHNSTVQSMINALQDPGHDYANAYEKNANMTDPAGILQTSAQAIQSAGDMMTQAINSFYTTTAGQTDVSQLPEPVQEFLSTAQNLGWALAGAYYLGISRMAQNYSLWTAPYTNPNFLNPNWRHFSDDNRADMNGFVINVTTFATNVAEGLAGKATNSEIISLESPGIQDSEKKALRPWLVMYPQIDRAFRAYILSTSKEWATLQFTKDPISGLIQLGADIESAAQHIWLAILGTVTALGILSAATLGVGISFISLALSWYYPFVMFTLATAISTGFLFEVYIPLIPFLLFTMGVLGWLILAIEAMVAAPLLALGILHPEGQHPVFGRGETGIWLLVGAFLRPSLMILGLVAAIPVSYAVVGFVNLGFTLALYSLAGSQDTGNIVVFRPVATALFMSLYAIIIMLTFNRVYSLIHVLPDRIMRWLGQPVEHGYSAEQDVQQLQQGVREAGQGIAKSKGESLEAQAGAAKDLGEATSSSKNPPQGGPNVGGG